MDIFIVLLVLFFVWKIKFVSINDEYLSYKSSMAMRGFFMMLVMCHHLAQYTSGGMFFGHFVRIGFLTVSIFFFFSGYGLQKRHMSDDDYKKTFLKKRIPAIVIPYLIMTLVVWIVRAIGGKVFSLADIVVLFFKGEAIVPFSWYFTNILVFYLAFYLIMKLFGNKHHFMIVGAFACYLIWILICKKAGYDVWWYCSSHLFVVGMVWAKYEKTILEFIKKHYFSSLGILIGAFFVCIVLYLLMSRYNQFIDAVAVTKINIAVLFVLAVLLFSLKVKIGNPILDFFGKISFELYLSHGMFIWLFNRVIDNDVLKSVFIILSSVLFAVVLHKALKVIMIQYNKKWGIIK